MLDLRNKNIYIGNQAVDRVYLGEELLKGDEPPIYIATDGDFEIVNRNHIYIGSALEVDITDYVNRKDLTSVTYMFSGSYDATPVTKVVLGPNNVTRMGYMFRSSLTTSLDLSTFDTSNVTNMGRMFRDFQGTTLDLSSFDTSAVTDMTSMFMGSQSTIGYARTQADADKFNSSSLKPAGLTFVVHPDLI